MVIAIVTCLRLIYRLILLKKPYLLTFRYCLSVIVSKCFDRVLATKFYSANKIALTSRILRVPVCYFYNVLFKTIKIP